MKTPEEKRATKRAWYANHQDQERSRKTVWYAAHIEQERLRKRKFYADHIDQERKRSRDRYRENATIKDHMTIRKFIGFMEEYKKRPTAKE